MRLTAAAATAICVLASIAPASAGAQEADPCPQRAEGPRHSARSYWRIVERERDLRHEVWSSVRLCDHRTGRELAVRRAVLADDERPSGRFIGDASVARGRLAWIEARFTPRGRTRYRAAAVVVVRSLRTGRLLRRFVADRAHDEDPFSGATGHDRPRLGVELTPYGELAWMAASRLVVDAPDRPPRVLARDAEPPLSLEDGRTLVWRTFPELRVHDLHPLPTAGGCPVRARWAPVADAPDVLVTLATYPGATHLRACLRSRGDDPVIASTRAFEAERSYVGGVTAGHGHVGYTIASSGRYGHCQQVVHVIDLAAWRRTRRATILCGPGTDGRHGPVPGTPFVVTRAGAAAWIMPPLADPYEPRPAVLLALDRRDELVELDRGDLGDLRADGEEIAWTNAGEARTARP